MKKHITINDIAKRAKLAKGTVSMALNNDKRISEETRKKVLKIAADLNYVPNESARKLATGESESIAFIAPRFTAPFVSSILSAVEIRAFKTGKYTHGIVPYSTRNLINVKEELLKKILYGRKADAVVLITSKPSPQIVSEYAKIGIPLLLVENEVRGAHSIMLDNAAAAYKATSYLIKKYGKNIAIDVGETDPPLGEELNYVSYERLKGYKQALNENMIEFNEALVHFSRGYVYETGIDAYTAIKKSKVKINGIFCASGDRVAMGIIEQAKKDGLKVPQDLAVVGFDDTLAARLMTPPLTTIKQPLEEMGTQVFDMATAAIEGSLKQEKHIVIEPELIIRESA